MDRSGGLPERADTNHARVLVVHEDAAFTCAVRRLFADPGYSVVECNRRDDALLGIIRGDEYDVILYDVVVGADEALDFHRQVAVMSPGLAARIVFLSAEEIPLALANPRIVKPVSADELRAWVTEFVSLRTMPPVVRGGD